MRSNTVSRSVFILFLTAVISMGMWFLSGCAHQENAEPAYTFTVPDEDGKGQWTVRYSKSGVVRHDVRPGADAGKTDIVFTGLHQGTTNATIYRAQQGMSADRAYDVYVLTLTADYRKRVTESNPGYGAYTVVCGNEITGAQWQTEYDASIVHLAAREKPLDDVSDGDGMQTFNMEYTFTGRRPGAVHVRIQAYLPWAEITRNHQDFWLYVDSEYRVHALEMTSFESFRVSEQGSTAGRDVYEAQKTADGVRLTHYLEFPSWSDTENAYVDRRENETVIEGGETQYRYLAGLLHECAAGEWDGFQGSNPHVIDGTSFTFEAKLTDGKTVSASGTNRFPEHYGTLRRALNRLWTQEEVKNGNF